MRHIISFSGGKDSTAMLIMMLEKGMQIDDIVYFDCGNREFPQMAEHIRQVEEYIGRQITRLYPSRGDLNYWMFDYKPKPRKGNTPKIGKAWPGPTLRWCTGLKTNAINKYYSQYRGEGIISYVGFAADEINRMIRPNTSSHWYESRFPLFDFDMTEADCLEYCHSKGFTWGGLYNHFKRVSCWCCPLQPLKELKQLYLHFPELWERLKDMDRRAWNTFRSDGQSVEDLERRFYFEEVQQGKLEMV